MIKLQCASCKATREITAREARSYSDAHHYPCCAKCGSPEVVISATADLPTPSRASHAS